MQQVIFGHPYLRAQSLFPLPIAVVSCFLPLSQKSNPSLRIRLFPRRLSLWYFSKCRHKMPSSLTLTDGTNVKWSAQYCSMALDYWLVTFSSAAPSVGVEAISSSATSRHSSCAPRNGNSGPERAESSEQTCLSAASFVATLLPLPWQHDDVCLCPRARLSDIYQKLCTVRS